MPTVQKLKKKLKVIRSTQKFTKAMKTAATIKYAKLSEFYANYEKYEEQCSRMYQSYREDINAIFPVTNPDAPTLYVLLSSNKGICSGLNVEVFSFFENIYRKEKTKPVIICCGKKGKEHLDSLKIPYKNSYVFADIPSYEDSDELFDAIKKLMEDGVVSAVKIVYPGYSNLMIQKPVCSDLFTYGKGVTVAEEPLYVPDKQTVMLNTAEKIIVSILHKKILETALGVQAATLTTMRSAYDTACEYSDQLEMQINRMRQSQVTADVIEVSSEYSVEEEE